MPRWAATLAVASVAVASVGATGCSESGDGGTDAGTATTVAPLAVGEFRSVIVAGAMDVDVTVGAEPDRRGSRDSPGRRAGQRRGGR
jgi:hypothetical protein